MASKIPKDETPTQRKARLAEAIRKGTEKSLREVPMQYPCLLLRLIDCSISLNTFGANLLVVNAARLSSGNSVGYVKLIGSKSDSITFAKAMLEEAEAMDE